MEITLETINILFFLIPGFISSFIIDSIIVRKESSTVKRIIESLIFTFIIYLITNAISGIELFASLSSKDGQTVFSFSQNNKFLLTLSLTSLLLPIFIGTVLYHDYHMAILRFLKITDKTSRDTTWQDVFVENKKFIVIHLKDERRIFGWPMYYSNVPENGIIYLYEPSWIDDENNYIECGTHGILIKSEEIQFIEFLNINNQKGSSNEKSKPTTST